VPEEQMLGPLILFWEIFLQLLLEDMAEAMHEVINFHRRTDSVAMRQMLRLFMEQT
jgi:hypothetical protein